MPYYLNPKNSGISLVTAKGDGSIITVKWNRAFPTTPANLIAYNIYMDEVRPDFEFLFFNKSPVFVSTNGALTADIADLTPGQMYRFAVRAVEYDPTVFDLRTLPAVFNNLRVYPESPLRANMTTVSAVVPLLSIDDFPLAGVVRVGAELIQYNAVDIINNNLAIVGAGTSGNAYLIDQVPPTDAYYKAASTNVGDGYIRNLSLVDTQAPAETWTIKCIFTDGYYGIGNTFIKTAQFEAFGSISGNLRDGYGEPFVWNDVNQILSNNILSFSIDGYAVGGGYIPFALGDYFTIQVGAVTAGSNIGRGFNGTDITIHNTDGYDGYVYWDPTVLFFPVDSEEQNTVVFATQDRFDKGNHAFTADDGYRQNVKDIVNADLSVSDTTNANFPVYDYVGYHRIDPVALFNGECVGSYFGGQLYCADGYSGVGRQIRGISVDDRNTQRQEVLLSVIGEPVCLVKRQWTGIRCYCVLSTSEHPDARCKKCYGTGYVSGYQQYFDSRHSDGKIRIKFEPWVDDLPLTDSGLEVEATKPSAWTLVLPALKKRDFIVRFDQDGNEEYRYEILNITRNILFNQQFGAQKMALQRIRKTDIIYMTPVFRDTSAMPTTIQTSIVSSAGILPHSHSLVKNEKHPMFWQQLTSTSAGHNHTVRWNATTGFLEVSVELGHTHILTY